LLINVSAFIFMF